MASTFHSFVPSETTRLSIESGSSAGDVISIPSIACTAAVIQILSPPSVR